MKKKFRPGTRALRFAVLLLLFAAARPAGAQNAIFLSQGKIEYERRINQYARMDDDNSWTELQKKTMSQFKTSYFDLLFNRSKTLYKPGKESPDKPNPFFGEQPALDNTVYADLDNEKSVSQKKIFEEVFLVQDSLRKIKWKITDETRTIAGFSCRRANALIMDSIYVVAFYTDEILTPGGPESFSGLPGMILEVALPHQHITWSATKVEAVTVPDTQLTAPAKGKKMTNTTLLQTIQHSLKDWGKQGQQYMQLVML
jgi:GLPGLI family protein